MSNCDNDCENCKIEEFCGYSIDTLGYAKFSRLVEEHDAKVRAEVIDECIAKINKLNIEYAYPHTICNILEQLKEKSDERTDN